MVRKGSRCRGAVEGGTVTVELKEEGKGGCVLEGGVRLVDIQTR